MNRAHLQPGDLSQLFARGPMHVDFLHRDSVYVDSGMNKTGQLNTRRMMLWLSAIARIRGRGSNYQIQVFDQDIVKIADPGKEPGPIWPGGNFFCLDRSKMRFRPPFARIISGIESSPTSTDGPKDPFGLE